MAYELEQAFQTRICARPFSCYFAAILMDIATCRIKALKLYRDFMLQCMLYSLRICGKKTLSRDILVSALHYGILCGALAPKK